LLDLPRSRLRQVIVDLDDEINGPQVLDRPKPLAIVLNELAEVVADR
jgi:hypothetical protein